MEKMKLQKVESYEAGYCGITSGTVKKAIVVTAAAAAMAGGLTGCFRHSLSGDVEYNPPEYDGYMSVESVSDSDCVSSDDEMIALDGDVAYIPSDQG